MDYAGGQFAMMSVLPDEVDGLRDVAVAQDASELRKIQNGLAAHNGNIFLPKFKIETEIDSDTNIRALSALGMKQAFADSADFSGMVSNCSPHIGKVIHKAVIEVDEKGTKAAAATQSQPKILRSLWRMISSSSARIIRLHLCCITRRLVRCFLRGSIGGCDFCGRAYACGIRRACRRHR